MRELFWISRPDRTLDEKGSTCPFCYAPLYVRNGVECPTCSFVLTDQSLKTLLDYAAKWQRFGRPPPLYLRSIDQISKIEYTHNSNQMTLAGGHLSDRSSQPLQNPAVIVDVDILGATNALEDDVSRLSFWFVILSHELLHLAMPRRALGGPRDRKLGRRFRERQRFTLEGEIVVRRATRRLFIRIPQVLEHYAAVLGTLGVEDHQSSDSLMTRCSVASCLLHHVSSCVWCRRELCEKHLPIKAHYPCKRKRTGLTPIDVQEWERKKRS